MIRDEHVIQEAYCDSCHCDIATTVDVLGRYKQAEYAVITREFHWIPSLGGNDFYELCLKCWEKAMAVLNLPQKYLGDKGTVMADGTSVPWVENCDLHEAPCPHPAIVDGGERGMVCQRCGDQFEVVPRSNDSGEEVPSV
jgi:hypothetical protein